MFPSLPARGCGEQCKQPGDLEHFIGVQSRSWCEYIFFSEIFAGLQATEDHYNQIFVGSGPPDPHGISAYAKWSAVARPAKVSEALLSL